MNSRVVLALLMVFSVSSWAEERMKPATSIQAHLDTCSFRMTDFYGGTHRLTERSVPHLFYYSKLINPKSKKHSRLILFLGA